MNAKIQNKKEKSEFKLEIGETYKGRCAEVLITNKNKFVLNCLFCNGKFRTLYFLEKHASTVHNYEVLSHVDDTLDEEFLPLDVKLEEFPDVLNSTFTGQTQPPPLPPPPPPSTSTSTPLTVNEENNANILKTEEQVWIVTPYQKLESSSTTEKFHGNKNCKDITTAVELQETEECDVREDKDDDEAEEKKLNTDEEHKESVKSNIEKKVKEKTRKTPPKRRLSNKKPRPNNSNSERKHVCPICSFAFADRSNLCAHLRRHSGVKNHACDQCSKRFFTRTELETHQRFHTGERPYICSLCGKGCTTISDLHEHERRHTNDRRYRCPHCEKTFYKTKYLKDHVVVHTQERNHVCEICSSRFLRRKALQSHMKIHENKREYVCNICQAAYNQKPALYIHVKTKHGVGAHKHDLEN